MSRILFYNGAILTLDNENNIFSSMLIEGGLITHAGDSPDLWDIRDSDSVVDLEGKTVLPGFNDNHIHLNFLGDSLVEPDLSGLDEEQIVGKLKYHYSSLKKNQLVTGSRWDYPACTKPDKEILDRAFPDNPVLLSQYGGHALWVNSAALKKMKLEEQAPDGLIRDISENSYLVNLYIKKLINRRRNRSNLERSLKVISKYGITSVQDNTWSFVTVQILKQLFRRSKPTCRVSCWSHGEISLFRFLFDRQRFDKSFITRGPAKYFLDGTLTARTAWLKEPYANDGENCGAGRSKKEIRQFLRKEISRRNRVAVHAIGDRAVSEFLDALEELEEEYDYIPELRLRLEHAQLISPEDMDRIKRLGVLVSAQPSALNNPEKDKRILGKARAERAYPYKSLLDKGVPLSFGSDAPGEDTINPFDIISYAVNREGPEKITVAEALRCYTSGSAFAEFREREKGMLVPGMAADFNILSADPLQCSPEEIIEIKVLKTYVAGQCINLSYGEGADS